MSDVLLEAGARYETELEIKRSRFITVLARVATEAEARAVIDGEKRRFPDARHHCSAYVVSVPGSAPIHRSSDDGEPSGTAGRPMLDTLLGAGVTDAVAVVTRYFGGTLLGTGGLVRAYSDSVTQALGQARMVERRVVPRYQAFLPHSDAGKYIATLSGAGFTPEMDYHDQGVELHISTERGAALAAMMAELSAGNVGVEQIEDAIIEVPYLDKHDDSSIAR